MKMFLFNAAWMAVFFMPAMAMLEPLDITIVFDPKRTISGKQVPSIILEKCKLFGLNSQQESEQYIFVAQANVLDNMDRLGSVSFRKNLRKSIPYAIQRDYADKDKTEQDSIILEYLFPKYVPKSFVQAAKNFSQRHKLYDNGPDSLFVRYKAESLCEIPRQLIVKSAQKEFQNYSAQYPELDLLSIILFFL